MRNQFYYFTIQLRRCKTVVKFAYAMKPIENNYKENRGIFYHSGKESRWQKMIAGHIQFLLQSINVSAILGKQYYFLAPQKLVLKLEFK